MRRGLTIEDIKHYKPKVLEFSGDWFDSIGHPEQTGIWFIWGDSGQGKSYFAMQLAKYLSNFLKVCYNALEEGLSATTQTTINNVNFNNKKNFILLDKEPIKDLIKRLQRKKSPNVVIIDSLQYSEINYKKAIELKEMFPKKIFIYISHADGIQPRGSAAKSIRFNANVKIFVSDFQAQVTSRYGGGKPFVIWADRINKLTP